MKSATKNTRIVNASPRAIYNAFTDPAALVAWQAPGNMTAQIHHFDLKIGGGYEMSLFYPEKEGGKMKGKTSENEDRYRAKFIELVPFKKIVQAINFDARDPGFAGEMIMEVTLEARGDATLVTIVFENIPAGIDPGDNEAGTESSLDKLALYVGDERESHDL
ncbi:hypothetical protein GCM10023091_29310 [Ravibacter arvi]|uniref:Activator of Hsp90 ATPase homologue 1/2-like C-terminal domain-containing protein n=1 Tax=Ravibacter arvi TaxID=2051041 RepID=A0ABP8M177_9BACT